MAEKSSWQQVMPWDVSNTLLWQAEDKLRQKPCSWLLRFCAARIHRSNFLFTFAVFLQTSVDLWWKQFQFCHLENSGEDRKRDIIHWRLEAVTNTSHNDLGCANGSSQSGPTSNSWWSQLCLMMLRVWWLPMRNPAVAGPLLPRWQPWKYTSIYFRLLRASAKWSRPGAPKVLRRFGT